MGTIADFKVVQLTVHDILQNESKPIRPSLAVNRILCYSIFKENKVEGEKYQEHVLKLSLAVNHTQQK